jgi:hypothetical protein
MLDLADWLVHQAGLLERAKWTREQKEVDAGIRSLRISVGKTKQLCIQVRGESTLDIALLEGTKGQPRWYGFVFDMLYPAGATTLFTIFAGGGDS